MRANLSPSLFQQIKQHVGIVNTASDQAYDCMQSAIALCFIYEITVNVKQVNIGLYDQVGLIGTIALPGTAIGKYMVMIGPPYLDDNTGMSLPTYTSVFEYGFLLPYQLRITASGAGQVTWRGYLR